MVNDRQDRPELSRVLRQEIRHPGSDLVGLYCSVLVLRHQTQLDEGLELGRNGIFGIDTGGYAKLLKEKMVRV